MAKSMKCFDVVRAVLDATYDEVPGDESKRDAAIRKALTSMSDRYRNDLMTKGGPDFSDAVTRFAYVFMYVPAHSHWVYELVDQSHETQDILSKGKARVTCVGGGPGSDLVGLLKYLDEAELECKLFCELIDGCEQWKTTWGDLGYTLDSTSIHTDYVIHDVNNKKSWDSPSKIAKADIITLNFFVSEVFRHEPKNYLKKVLGAAKSGAVVLFNDNRTPSVYSLVDSVAKDAGFAKLLSEEGTRKIFDSGEKMSALKKYLDKFDFSSRLTGNMSWRIFQKE